MEESEAQPARPGVDYVWLGEGCHHWQVRMCACVCMCVPACVCVVLESWNAQLEELKSLLGHPFELPRSPLTGLSLFSCLFLELVYKLNGPQSHRVGLLILKQDLCCRAHCFALLSAQPPRKRV